MQKISRQELVKLVDEQKGAEPVSVDIVTTPNMRKTGNPYLGCTKSVTLSGMFNFDYENSVNNQLAREGKDAEFEAQKRAWGERVGNWIKHDDAFYLQLKVQGASTPVYVDAKGARIDPTLLEPFIYKSKKPHTQEDLDKQIVVRSVKLENIAVIRVKGAEYLVV